MYTITKQTNRTVRDLKYKLLNYVHIVTSYFYYIHPNIQIYVQGVFTRYDNYTLKLYINVLDRRVHTVCYEI